LRSPSTQDKPDLVRVLVTGGTGFIGGAVVRELAARGHAVRVLCRPASSAERAAEVGAEVVRGELTDAAAVRGALAGCEAVVHAAGRVLLRPAVEHELRIANVDTVEVVLGEALAAGVARAVFTSSTAVLGGGRTPAVLDERSAGNAESLGIPYFTAKLEGERRALAISGRGLPLVVLRPSFVLGPGDVHGSSAGMVVALARRRVPGYVEGGASFCDVRDVARAHAEALERGRPGEIYTLGGHNLTTTEMVTRVCELSGAPVPRKMPFSAALAISAAEEITAGLQKRRPSMTRDLVRAAALYTFASSDKARAELAYAIRPFDEMVIETLRWAMAAGKLAADTDALKALASGAPAA
jgi:dihydroflavonol-4-reductase